MSRNTKSFNVLLVPVKKLTLPVRVRVSLKAVVNKINSLHFHGINKNQTVLKFTWQYSGL